jgi:outer membrane protein TolC
LFAQDSVERLMAEIEKNNISLIALRKSTDAEKTGNKTGNFLPNPEFGFNYLWGSQDIIGNRTDINITQSFDFPTSYTHRNKIATLKNEQAELVYFKQKMDLLLEARLLCYELIYTNALLAELSKRKSHAQKIADAYKSGYDLGETSILEYNKARLNFLNINKENETLEIKRKALMSKLFTMNGGHAFEFNEIYFPATALPENFEDWYLLAEQNNPVLNWLKQEIEVSQKQQKLNRSMSLPKFNAGYMSEKVDIEQFQGITVGVAIPLFENKNTVKYSKAKTQAAESIQADKKWQLYNHLQNLFSTAQNLQSTAQDYRETLSSINNTDLLMKALDKGHITLIEYMMELSIYYESFNNLLELEKELNTTLAELTRYM